MTPARATALFFAASHIVVGFAGTARPGVYAWPVLGEGASDAVRRRLRILAFLDALPAVAVADAVVRDRPLASRLRWGAASDLTRIAALRLAMPEPPKAGYALLTGASLTGAALATALSARVD